MQIAMITTANLVLRSFLRCRIQKPGMQNQIPSAHLFILSKISEKLDITNFPVLHNILLSQDTVVKKYDISVILHSIYSRSFPHMQKDCLMMRQSFYAF